VNSGTGMGLQHKKQKVFYKTSLAGIMETLQVLQKTYIKVKGESALYSSCINLSKALLLHLKGLGHEMNMYLKLLQSNRYFLYMLRWFNFFRLRLLTRKRNTKILLASMKTLPILKLV
jgi:hypothetical protein